MAGSAREHRPPGVQTRYQRPGAPARGSAFSFALAQLFQVVELPREGPASLRRALRGFGDLRAGAHDPAGLELRLRARDGDELRARIENGVAVIIVGVDGVGNERALEDAVRLVRGHANGLGIELMDLFKRHGNALALLHSGFHDLLCSWCDGEGSVSGGMAFVVSHADQAGALEDGEPAHDRALPLRCETARVRWLASPDGASSHRAEGVQVQRGRGLRDGVELRQAPVVHHVRHQAFAAAALGDAPT